ncbi:MAG: class I SAM-dependent methyltransferase, partial [Candidatus Eremiobacteraeota bacterium]|nr:class I SAM-dependent methyltransferase [Candidatus Eremiobacteraeota bacterium]
MSVNPLGESTTISRDPAPWASDPQDDDAEVVNVNKYARFADIYDVFGSEDFCLTMTSHILDALERYRMPPGAEVVDVACGTGVITIELAKAGYNMVGLDLSHNMLAHAQRRALASGVTARFTRADMRTFRLQEKTPCIISTHDSLDHLFDDEELDLAFESISQALRPGGLFIFDMNCWDGIRHLDGRTVFVETHDKSGAYHLIAEERTLETNIVGFIQVEDNLYERFDETLYQRCYSNEEIEERLEEFGLELLER